MRARRCALPPVLSIVGWSGSGKTTLIERLLPELTRAGLAVGTVKHHHGRPDAGTARDAKDSERHARAGAAAVALASSDALAVLVPMRKPTLEVAVRAACRAAPVALDLVLAEGFTSEARTAIRLCDRRGRRRPLPRECEVLAELDFEDPQDTPARAVLARLVLAWSRRRRSPRGGQSAR